MYIIFYYCVQPEHYISRLSQSNVNSKYIGNQDFLQGSL